jgi:hypothetical protein
MCLNDQKTFDQIETAFNNFMKCRSGNDLNDFDPVMINQVLKASCNGFNSTSGAKFDLPKIRSQMAEELKKAGVRK